MIDLDEQNLAQGVLALVITLVEVIKEALNLQAIKRVESGGLTEDEVERLGRALMDLDIALDQIKREQGISDAVRQVRDGLDNLVDDVLNGFLRRPS